MCEALSDLSQDDSGLFMICNCLHSWVACLFFQIFDLFAVLYTISMYLWFIYEEGWGSQSEMTIVPLAALILSIMIFPLGPIGLIMQNGLILFLYNIRILCIIIFSGCWSVYVYSGGNTQYTIMTVGGVWSFAFINYIWGFTVTFKAIRYCNEFYRGYSDVDADEMSNFVVEFEDKLEELKEKEEENGQKVTKRKEVEKSTEVSKVSKESTVSKENMSKQTVEVEQSKTK